MQTTKDKQEKPQRQDLDGRYGQIGMPALAAALRYPSDCKNTEYAPANIEHQPDDREAA